VHWTALPTRHPSPRAVGLHPPKVSNVQPGSVRVLTAVPQTETLGPHAPPGRVAGIRKRTAQTAQVLLTELFAQTVLNTRTDPRAPRVAILSPHRNGPITHFALRVVTTPVVHRHLPSARSTRRASHLQPCASVPKRLRTNLQTVHV
jgi:hypothetical protein